ncbi:MAG: hypothetical protein DRP87_03530 [Spirochaetes bacterium]|nr:MAG: hypothetical protein DRP87_03530 [Spirochaetota bacterium]
MGKDMDYDKADVKEKLRVLIPHLLEHNSEHIKDLKKWIDKASSAGFEEIRAELEKTVNLSEEISRSFKRAIDLLDKYGN